MEKLSKQKYNTDIDTLKREVMVEPFRSSGPGGQRKNKVATAIRLKHIPSEITVVATEYRYQSQNLKLAFDRLQERLRKLNQPKKRRIPTSVPGSVIEKKKEKKKILSKQKRLRKNPSKDKDPWE